MIAISGTRRKPLAPSAAPPPAPAKPPCLGGLALKWNWRKRQRAKGKSTDAPNLVMGPVQVCWHKFAATSTVEIREVPWKAIASC